MSKCTPISMILQEAICDEAIQSCIEQYNVQQRTMERHKAESDGMYPEYHDTGRIMTVCLLFRYFLLSAILKSDSFRELQLQGEQYSLARVDYSTISKKAKAVPFQIYLTLCNQVLEKTNRLVRRKMKPTWERLTAAIDSTCITAHKTKLPWAPYLRESSGIKYHVKFELDSRLPTQVVTSPIQTPDSEKLLSFGDQESILICDRGYRSVEKMCKLDQKQQRFIIRLKDNISLRNQIPFDMPHDEAYTDILCTLGKDRALKKEYRERQFRVICFPGSNGKPVMLCTNVLDLPTETIAQMYRKRWRIECFFRQLKQNFSIKKIFGTTENAAYSQGLIAFIAYVLTYCPFTNLVENLKFTNTFSNFLRLLRANYICVDLVTFRHSLYHLLP